MKPEELRHLLEMSAKVHGGLLYVEDMDAWIHVDSDGRRGAWWHPEDDDGDSRRLEVYLNIEVRWHLAGSMSYVTATAAADIRLPVMREYWSLYPCGISKRAAARLAVLRCAAVIGESMS